MSNEFEQWLNDVLTKEIQFNVPECDPVIYESVTIHPSEVVFSLRNMQEAFAAGREAERENIKKLWPSYKIYRESYSNSIDQFKNMDSVRDWAFAWLRERLVLE